MTTMNTITIDGEEGWEDMGDGLYVKHEPPVKVPEVPPECWAKAVDAERAIQAVRAMCG